MKISGKRISSLILSVILYSQYSFAACDKPVTYLLENDKAPCNGYLFTPDKELDVRLKILERESLIKQLEINREINDIQKLRIEEYQKYSDALKMDLKSEQTKNEWTRYGWFGLGVLSSILIMYAQQKISN
jgi:hypothetical protein